jgi:hypothetical protein
MLLLILSEWAKGALDDSNPGNNFQMFATLRAWKHQIHWTGKILSILLIGFGLILFFGRLGE